MGGLRLAKRLHRHVSGEKWSSSCETLKSENNKPLPLLWECSNRATTPTSNEVQSHPPERRKRGLQWWTAASSHRTSTSSWIRF